MNEFIVTEIAAGVEMGATLQLTPEQAKARMYGLSVIDADEGLYRVEQNLQFKMGETFGYEPAADAGRKKDAFLADVTPREEFEEAALSDKLKALTKRQIIALIDDDDKFDLELTMNMSKDTMIEAIENAVDMLQDNAPDDEDTDDEE
jgi:hypothetical protein